MLFRAHHLFEMNTAGNRAAPRRPEGVVSFTLNAPTGFDQRMPRVDPVSLLSSKLWISHDESTRMSKRGKDKTVRGKVPAINAPSCESAPSPQHFVVQV